MFRYGLLTAIVVGCFVTTGPVRADDQKQGDQKPDEQNQGVQKQGDQKDWIFDAGPYSQSPKTGQRVDQYAKKKPDDRIPYDQYFSPNGPQPYGMYLGFDRDLDGTYPYHVLDPYPWDYPNYPLPYPYYPGTIPSGYHAWW